MNHEPSGRSRPAVPVDVIADLHAGVLSEEQARTVRGQIATDPASQRVLAALDATVDDLLAAPVEPVEPPPAVSAAIDATLRALRDEMASPRTASSPGDEPTGVISLADAREARRRRNLGIAVAAAVLAAVVGGVVAVTTASRPTSDTSTVRADPSSAAGPSSAASPSSAAAPPAATGVTGSPVALLSVVGREDPTLGDPRDPASRLRGCLAANGVSGSVPVLGSGPVVLDGQRRTVVLLTTGVAGRFDALVVGEGCGPGRPEFVSRQTIGVTPPSR